MHHIGNVKFTRDYVNENTRREGGFRTMALIIAVLAIAAPAILGVLNS